MSNKKKVVYDNVSVERKKKHHLITFTYNK